MDYVTEVDYYYVPLRLRNPNLHAVSMAPLSSRGRQYLHYTKQHEWLLFDLEEERSLPIITYLLDCLSALTT